MAFFRKEAPAKSWFGPVAKAPAWVRERLARTPSWQTLHHRGWSDEATLVFAPEPNPKSVVEPVVLARIFSWDDRSPDHWIVTTCGVSLVAQQADANTFRHVELVLISNNTQDPIPSRVATALRLPIWTTTQVPPLFHWLAAVGRTVGTGIESGDIYGPRDGMELGPGDKEWTASKLSRGVLMPAPTMLLAAGMGPYTEPTDDANVIDASAWSSAYGHDRFSSGFLWFLPLDAADYGRLATESLGVIVDELLEAGERAGDPMSVVANFLR
ncbi:MAG: hypothetical protein H0V17_00890 [Deltaproteobacteria bacterium]|nr:hypothetical protein [Deltaproteobacteria bacterium]